MEHIFHEPQFGENWFTYANFYQHIVQTLPNNSHIVEVGSWKGKSAAFMAVEIINSGKNILFDCVDTWKGSIEHTNDAFVKSGSLFDLFLSNIEPIKHIIKPIRMKSVDASYLYDDKSLEFVFLDASHEYEHIKQDIEHWLPKVKIGGILAGHDYDNHWPGVKKAVNEKFKSIMTRESCWIVNVK